MGLKFGFLSEADPRYGQTYSQRYKDLTDEVVLADRMGFNFFGTSEQHFALGIASVSAPECLFPFLFDKTQHIRFRHVSTLLPRAINHPLRVAERIATQDILSDGRIELCTARGNTLLALRGFEVDIDQTRAEWEEGIDLIKAAFTEDPFSFDGDIYHVPPRSLIPKQIQMPYPPIMVASTGPDSLQRAAQKGIGVVTSALERGWAHLEETISTYKKEVARVHVPGVYVNTTIGVNATAHCAATVEQAMDEAAAIFVAERKLAGDAYERLSKLSPDYSYMTSVTDLARDMESVDYLVKESGSVIIGDPDSFIEFAERYEQLGADEIWFRLDSLPHEQLMRSIELIGRYVIPHFRNKLEVVRPPEENRARLRAKRRELADAKAAAGQ